VSENALVIRGERTHEAEQKEKTFWLHERLENMFERRFERPRGADAGKVSASFAKGVLSVHAPKAAVPTTRKVPIGT
jgi:HSP20 family protein